MPPIAVRIAARYHQAAPPSTTASTIQPRIFSHPPIDEISGSCDGGD